LNEEERIKNLGDIIQENVHESVSDEKNYKKNLDDDE
jgi:hypothetical protein